MEEYVLVSYGIYHCPVKISCVVLTISVDQDGSFIIQDRNDIFTLAVIQTGEPICVKLKIGFGIFGRKLNDYINYK